MRACATGSPMHSSRSTPARIAAITSMTWASPWGSAPMSRASVIVRPRNPRSSRTRSCITARDSVAGSVGSPVSAGQREVRGHDHVGAGLDGRPERHQLRRVEAGPVGVDHGQRSWVSRSAPPSPGKCFAPAAMPELRRPRTCAAASRATAAGSLPNERMPMCGLAGLSARSHTGAYDDVHAHREQLEAGRPPHPLGEVVVARGAERHVARERRRAAQRVELPALLVGRDQERRGGRVEPGGRPLDRRGQLAHLAGRPRVAVAEQRDPGGRARSRGAARCRRAARTRRTPASAARADRSGSAPPPPSALDRARQAADEVALDQRRRTAGSGSRSSSPRRRSTGSRPRRSPAARRGPPAASCRRGCGASATATGSRSTS